MLLQRLAAEDPSFRVETDIESGQTIMKGMGELHLDILVDRMRREFKVEANIGAPQVAYRETIGHEVEHTYTHKKQSGGSGQYAEVKLYHRPTGARSRVIRLSPRWSGARCQRNISQALKKGSNQFMDSGPLAWLPGDRLESSRCLMAIITMLTPAFWHLKLPRVWHA